MFIKANLDKLGMLDSSTMKNIIKLIGRMDAYGEGYDILIKSIQDYHDKKITFTPVQRLLIAAVNTSKELVDLCNQITPDAENKRPAGGKRERPLLA